ncbi:MAG: glycosyltransferase family 2 protein [Deltaproteobacteria bacterium]|nr:glycosyltransferase family 2 protein [Deltaproteobacteria bacterium]
MPKRISVVLPCFNEEENVRECYERVKNVIEKFPAYEFEMIFIDNASTDRTPEILRGLASNDKRVKVIFNARNFGHIRSPYYGMLQASGDAVAIAASDLQEPPELIAEFIKKWEEGFKVVMAVRDTREESRVMAFLRGSYYRLLGKISDIRIVKNATGFGLYDRKVLDLMREIGDPYPYFRGLVGEFGFEPAIVKFHMPARKRGLTKNNFYTLFDMAMLGMTNHSKVPLRLATMFGFAMSALSLFLSIGYLIAKLVFWDQFQLGFAPVLIGFFFIASVQLFFVGIVGEYIGAIYTRVRQIPPVVEKERLNFENDAPRAAAEHDGRTGAHRTQSGR